MIWIIRPCLCVVHVKEVIVRLMYILVIMTVSYRVVRAFLIEEQKIVKKVLAEKSKKVKKSDA